MLLCSISSSAYYQSIDSIKTVYLNAKGNIKIEASIDFARKLPPPDSLKAIFLFREALSQSQKNKYPQGEIRANHWWGWYYFENLHNPNKAIPLYRNAINLALKHKNYDEAFWVYAILKDVHVFLSDFTTAINVLNEEKDFVEKANLHTYLPPIYAGLLQCYGGVGDFKKANETFNEGMLLSKQIDDLHTIWLLLTTMSEIKLQQKNINQALAYLNKAIEVGIKTKEYYNVLNLQSKVNLLIKLNQLTQAETLCRSIQKRMSTIESFEFVGTNNASLGNIYLARKDYGNALKYSLDSYKETLKAGNEENLIKLDSTLFIIYKKLGDFENAFKHSSHFIELNEKLLSKDKIKQFQNVQYRHYMDKKQKQIEAEQRIKQAYILISIILFLTLMLGTIVFIITQKNSELKVKLLNETTKNEEQIRENMQFEMETQTRELTSMAMAIDQKNILWKNVQQKLKETLSAMPSISEQEIKSIFKIISQDNDSQHEWDTFKLHFESVHPQFFTTLSQIAPTLTQLELRQCAYIKINLAPKQVGNLLNITPDSVKKSRMRIKKKLNLSTEDNLSKFIANLKMA
ncbi:hypothetical protein LV89_04049 [Arcicella aurantiaca]|uniref:Uncharacterized protein n=1 Tax=Arcicella aurantiaca TaxID=591202 RepID=A0A316DL26_9BACT|nr:hypothetical protein [Arcicella aurantiaca]PWK18761.1 hypothetical protein LV89_04049 [Arcicella aurantiaca]